MKIFVEGTPLFIQRTGVGQYTKKLLEELFKIDKKNQYTIFGFLRLGKKLSRPFPENSAIRYRLIRYMPSKIFNVLIRKLVAPPIDLMLASKPDLFIFTNFVRYPLAFKEKSIVVIYDLSYIAYGQYTAVRHREYLLRYVAQSIEKSQHVVTISENSKREIINHYSVDPSKVTIVHPAIDHAFFYPRPAAEVNEIRQKYVLDRPYILYTGTLEPRKNIVGILDAYNNLKPDLRETHALVLAGGKGWLDKDISNRLEELRALNIRVTGYVPDDDLPALYSGASVFVYPSFYEGFGMPPLEAMACGVPVIAANNTSLPEVIGDAGILIDANDNRALTKNIERVLSDDKLAQKLRERGLMRAKHFRWESSAKKLLQVINAVSQN